MPFSGFGGRFPGKSVSADEFQKRQRCRIWAKRKPALRGADLTKRYGAVILEIERALPVDGWFPTLSYEVTATVEEPGAVTSFCCYVPVRTGRKCQRSKYRFGSNQNMSPLGSPPFRRSEGKKLPPVKRANRPPLLAALKDISFLLPAYHSRRPKATKKTALVLAPPGRYTGKGSNSGGELLPFHSNKNGRKKQ